jgi:hypothetical protein
MRWRQRSPQESTTADPIRTPVAEREILSGDEASARAQAERQQQLEQAPEAEWIYLRNKDGLWVARRTARDPQPSTPSRRERIFNAIADIFFT